VLCGRCVEACQNVEVNETLSINWEDEHPRVLWMVAPLLANPAASPAAIVSRLPVQCTDGKIDAGHAGFLTKLPKKSLDGMIDVVKAIEPEAGYGSILKISEAESAMRESRIRRTKTVCTYCGVGAALMSGPRTVTF